MVSQSRLWNRVAKGPCLEVSASFLASRRAGLVEVGVPRRVFHQPSRGGGSRGEKRDGDTQSSQFFEKLLVGEVGKQLFVFWNFKCSWAPKERKTGEENDLEE